jgi:hypothetical protein
MYRKWPVVGELIGEPLGKRRQPRPPLTCHFAYRCLAMLEKI